MRTEVERSLRMEKNTLLSSSPSPLSSSPSSFTPSSVSVRPPLPLLLDQFYHALTQLQQLQQRCAAPNKQAHTTGDKQRGTNGQAEEECVEEMAGALTQALQPLEAFVLQAFDASYSQKRQESEDESAAVSLSSSFSPSPLYTHWSPLSSRRALVHSLAQRQLEDLSRQQQGLRQIKTCLYVQLGKLAAQLKREEVEEEGSECISAPSSPLSQKTVALRRDLQSIDQQLARMDQQREQMRRVVQCAAEGHIRHKEEEKKDRRDKGGRASPTDMSPAPLRCLLSKPTPPPTLSATLSLPASITSHTSAANTPSSVRSSRSTTPLSYTLSASSSCSSSPASTDSSRFSQHSTPAASRFHLRPAGPHDDNMMQGMLLFSPILPGSNVHSPGGLSEEEATETPAYTRSKSLAQELPVDVLSIPQPYSAHSTPSSRHSSFSASFYPSRPLSPLQEDLSPKSDAADIETHEDEQKHSRSVTPPESPQARQLHSLFDKLLSGSPAPSRSAERGENKESTPASSTLLGGSPFTAHTPAPSAPAANSTAEKETVLPTPTHAAPPAAPAVVSIASPSPALPAAASLPSTPALTQPSSHELNDSAQCPSSDRIPAVDSSPPAAPQHSNSPQTPSDYLQRAQQIARGACSPDSSLHLPSKTQPSSAPALPPSSSSSASPRTVTPVLPTHSPRGPLVPAVPLPNYMATPQTHKEDSKRTHERESATPVHTLPATPVSAPTTAGFDSPSPAYAFSPRQMDEMMWQLHMEAKQRRTDRVQQLLEENEDVSKLYDGEEGEEEEEEQENQGQQEENRELVITPASRFSTPPSLPLPSLASLPLSRNSQLHALVSSLQSITHRSSLPSPLRERTDRAGEEMLVSPQKTHTKELLKRLQRINMQHKQQQEAMQVEADPTVQPVPSASLSLGDATSSSSPLVPRKREWFDLADLPVGPRVALRDVTAQRRNEQPKSLLHMGGLQDGSEENHNSDRQQGQESTNKQARAVVPPSPVRYSVFQPISAPTAQSQAAFPPPEDSPRSRDSTPSPPAAAPPGGARIRPRASSVKKVAAADSKVSAVPTRPPPPVVSTGTTVRLHRTASLAAARAAVAGRTVSMPSRTLASSSSKKKSMPSSTNSKP